MESLQNLGDVPQSDNFDDDDDDDDNDNDDDGDDVDDDDNGNDNDGDDVDDDDRNVWEVNSEVGGEKVIGREETPLLLSTMHHVQCALYSMCTMHHMHHVQCALNCSTLCLCAGFSSAAFLSCFSSFCHLYFSFFLFWLPAL